jgi:hypothetical protein
MFEKNIEVDTSDIPEIQDFSNWKPNPFLEKMKNGYSVKINFPPREERQKNKNDLFLTDDELRRLKNLIESEEQKRAAI